MRLELSPCNTGKALTSRRVMLCRAPHVSLTMASIRTSELVMCLVDLLRRRAHAPQAVQPSERCALTRATGDDDR